MIIFFGDSITRDWPIHDVAGDDALNLGISGETTRQMRARFEREVVARRPTVVHILGGINDIAENQGPVPVPEIAANLEAMATAASGAGIGVVLGRLLPCTAVVKRPHIAPRPAIRQVNASISSLEDGGGVVVADYFTPLAGEDERLVEAFTADGLHPNRAGYALMSPVARDALGRFSRPRGNRLAQTR